MSLLARALAVTITAQVINGPDAVLEPSVLNEVEHALAMVPQDETNAAVRATGDVFSTNGLSATAIAVKLVSAQRSDGRWLVNGTNCTQVAVAILAELAGGRETEDVRREAERDKAK